MEAVMTINQGQDRERLSLRTLSTSPTAATAQDISTTSGPGLSESLFASMLPSLLQPCHPQDQILASEPVFPFKNWSMEQIFQSDSEIFVQPSPRDLITDFPGMLDEGFTVPDQSPPQSDTRRSVASFTLEDTDYTLVQANVARLDPEGRLSNFQFPSKYAVVRFVKAFFSHMASNLPIVHGPTFEITAVPCLLLCWYLRAKKSCYPALERNPSVEALIEECAAELEGLQSITAGQEEVLPLAVTAELIQEDSVWQYGIICPKKLKKNATKTNAM
ncbi:hypothetical protein PENSUB_1066 [Penicillium subrubescens]|uniref:Uncharacterized protein n=1 Tax=Penicillium subrubescens TaxID=1316194 RepID=A0A1Q5UD92_9EURO|nr:hypothetical protein PENSUB_12541 [Penicillium subrubescens]OKP10456.1 hypothetical protein PENSUB_4113 [Penicillium subrubescens]OKP13242.1 hypothetical protein PENSUB_1066 [Penicillium subrubescens]